MFTKLKSINLKTTVMMTIILILLFLTAIIGVLSYMNIKSKYHDYAAPIGLLTILSVMFLVVVIMVTIGANWNQVADIESLKVIDDKIEIYENRVNQIGKDMEYVLVDKYSNHEYSIFKNMSPENLSILLVRYPELNSSATFIEYTKNLRQLYDEKYMLEIEKVDIMKRLSFRNKHPFALTFLIRKYNE